jgi:hypothetical protein
MAALSTIWSQIQRVLLPVVGEEIAPPTPKQRELTVLLDVIRIEKFVAAPPRGWRGRPDEDRRPLARAFVAKAVLNLPTTHALLDQLRSAATLRRICGWERRGDVPSEATFSRAFAAFAAGQLPQRVHAALIAQHLRSRLVGHISRDATAIKAREKRARRPRPAPAASPKKSRRGRRKNGETPPPKEPTRLQRQAAGMKLAEMVAELPVLCDAGCKRDSKGHTNYWIGYKLHVDWADGEIPVSRLLTSASLHDKRAALPLMRMTEERVFSLHQLMDAAYDAHEIWESCRKLGHVPIIDRQKRRGEMLPMDPAIARRFAERTTAARGNSGLQDNFGRRHVRVRGAVKVMAHLMFGILALCADRLLRLIT